MPRPDPLFRLWIAAGALALAGCASEPGLPTFGERVAAEGGQVSAIAARWNEGEAQIAKGKAMIAEGKAAADAGEALVSKGEKRIKEARRQIDRGERLIAEGRNTQRRAEQAYGALPGSAG